MTYTSVVNFRKTRMLLWWWVGGKLGWGWSGWWWARHCHRNQFGAQPADESQHCCFYKLNAIKVMEADAHRYNVAVSRNMRSAARFSSRSELFIKTSTKGKLCYTTLQLAVTHGVLSAETQMWHFLPYFPSIIVNYGCVISWVGWGAMFGKRLESMCSFNGAFWFK